MMFSRPTGDIEKQLSKVIKLSSTALIERIRNATMINEKRYDLSDKEKFNNNILEFTYFVKRVLP